MPFSGPLASLLHRLGLLRQQPAAWLENDRALQVLAPRVLLITYDPAMSTGGDRVTQLLGWNRVAELVAGYCADLEACSGGLLRYRVVEQIELDEFPRKVDGFRYDPASYMAMWRGHRRPHDPDWADYEQVVADFNLLERVARDEIDEVWIFAFPYSGFYESRMAGPGALWCNAPALEGTAACGRRFVIMGFSYERGVGEMLENFGHRAESLLREVFRRTRGADNLFERFCRYDQLKPGQAEVGTIHFAPNSERDYDWGNPRLVLSRCDEWYDFPHLHGKARPVNCQEWGNGDIRLHHRWWLAHLPRAAGQTNGIAHNWWRYIIDPNLI